MRSVPDGTEPNDHPLLGKTLRNTYRLVELLDQGGMGSVFVAQHQRLGRKLAVKVLAEHLSNDVHALARFHREAAIVAHLIHPNVVQVLDYDTTEEGQPSIVMELLRGESLATKLQREGRLELGAVVRVVQEVAQGLAAAHRAQVVHRDLKPANVFLAVSDDGRHEVKLLDFGISVRSTNDRRLTGEHDVLGTPDYMSPEQAAGRTAHVDHRADQYSLAVIAYEALGGATPFPSTELVEVLRHVVSTPPVPIQRIAPDVPTGVWLVLERALSKDPEQRFASVLDFSQAFALAARESLPPSTPPLRTSEPARSGSEEPRPGSARPGGRYRVSAPAGEDPEAQATRPTDPVPSARLTELASFIARAREAFGLGDVDLAASYVERAMRLADEDGSRAEKLAISAESALIASVLSSCIASQKDRALVRREQPTSTGLELRPEQAFLLSRLDHRVTVEELLDISPMPRHETLRHVVQMLRKGALGFE